MHVSTAFVMCMRVCERVTLCFECVPGVILFFCMRMRLLEATCVKKHNHTSIHVARGKQRCLCSASKHVVVKWA